MAWFSKFSATNRILIGILAGVAVLVIGYAAWNYWDARTNYVAAKARVTWVVDNCTLERRRTSSGGTRRETAPMDCETAQLKQSQGYSRWTLQRHRHVGYTFTSPVDGRSYNGSISATQQDYEGVRAGSEIDILAHKSDPAKSRRPI